MKKLIPVLAVVVLVGGAVTGYVLTKKGTTLVAEKPSVASSTTEAGDYKKVEACTAFTQADAEALLGAGAKKGDALGGDTSSDDINVSICTYSQSATTKTASLLARSAKTAAGATSNHGQFTTQLPAAAQTVTGFGDAAYWDPTYGQLNILAHNNWYILSSGGLRPADKSLDDAKALATRIMPRL